jgi:hypothetical protein
MKSWIRICLFLVPVIFYTFLTAAPTPAVTSGKELSTGKNLDVPFGPKGSVLVFLSAKCPCSNSHIALLKTMAEKFKDFSFVAIHSNADENLEDSKKYFQKVQLPFPVIQDDKTKLADFYKANRTPHVFVLSAASKVLYQGGITNSSEAPKADKNYLQEALQDIVAGRPVATPEGRTLGCGIKREEKHVW